MKITQKKIDKMKIVSFETLKNTKNSMRNYFVYIGETFPVMYEIIHIGFGSNNHYETIRNLLSGKPIYKVLLIDKI